MEDKGLIWSPVSLIFATINLPNIYSSTTQTQHFMSRWLGRWTCNQVQVLHLPLTGFVLGHPEFNSLAARCKYPTDLTPASWDF